MSEFYVTKPVQTRAGKKARILATGIKDKNGKTVVAAIDEGDNELLRRYQVNGRFQKHCESSYDLVNVPFRTSRFKNLYEDSRPTQFHETYADAIHLGTGRNSRVFLGVVELQYVDEVLVDAIFHKSSIG